MKDWFVLGKCLHSQPTTEVLQYRPVWEVVHGFIRSQYDLNIVTIHFCTPQFAYGPYTDIGYQIFTLNWTMRILNVGMHEDISTVCPHNFKNITHNRLKQVSRMDIHTLMFLCVSLRTDINIGFSFNESRKFIYSTWKFGSIDTLFMTRYWDTHP